MAPVAPEMETSTISKKTQKNAELRRGINGKRWWWWVVDGWLVGEWWWVVEGWR